MRSITLIIIHCSAVKPHIKSSAQDIDAWHRQRGMDGIGYHYVIRRDGSIETGRPETQIGAHCKDHNKNSLGICYEGGLDRYGRPADTRTPEQKEALLTLLKDLKKRYPHAIITGHYTFNPRKACPCFDAAHEYLWLSNLSPDGSASNHA